MLWTFTKPGEDEAAVEGIDQAVTVLVRGIAIRIPVSKNPSARYLPYCLNARVAG